jgi:hypothetical protein
MTQHRMAGGIECDAGARWRRPLPLVWSPVFVKQNGVPKGRPCDARMRFAAVANLEEMMPRKQRFKPSRKPKPVDSPMGDGQNHSPSETGNIDHGGQQRPDDRNGVIEAAGETA